MRAETGPAAVAARAPLPAAIVASLLRAVQALAAHALLADHLVVAAAVLWRFVHGD